jgi:ribosome-associated heat shock protein Hsp15
MPTPTTVRMDKWLWAVRIFKTRALAAAACHHGKVTVNNQAAKASRDVHINETIVVKKDDMTRTFKVLQLLEQRVSAVVAREFAEDQTPAAELEKARERRLTPIFYRPKGAGRPTKKERRDLNDTLDSF